MTEEEPLETYEQVKVASFLNRSGLLWCHVPNGGFRAKATATRLKYEGVKKGVPDILIFSKGIDGNPTAIELKRRTKGRVSPEQKQWLNDLTEAGWESTVCKGADKAILLIRKRYGL